MFDPTAEDITGWAQRQADKAAEDDLLAALQARVPQTAPVPPDLHQLAATLRTIADQLDALADARVSGSGYTP